MATEASNTESKTLLEELKGFIGLSSDAPTQPESGLCVDALPDITIDVIDKLKTLDANADETWENIERRSILKLRTLFIAEVNRCHKVHDIAKCECLIKENKVILATSLWYLCGAEVMLTRTASSRINYATIDRNKPKEIRQYFEDQFKKELEVAVAGIDIHSSSCFLPDEQPECASLIETVYAKP